MRPKSKLNMLIIGTSGLSRVNHEVVKGLAVMVWNLKSPQALIGWNHIILIQLRMTASPIATS